ncbi:MAG: hypothetical protein CM1200mP26_19390 [Acidimicrobiales bacterium]|nr:MAG: hypothetical protein CM1200mP26_19390 [Acidimicrobiales bacterium]
MSHERGTNPRQLVIHSQLLDELVRLAKGVRDRQDSRTSSRLAQAFVELRVFQLQNWRALSRLQSGKTPGGETTTAKLYWSEMSQRFHATAMQVLADAAPLWKGATDNPGDGRWQRSWLYYRAASIFAGTKRSRGPSSGSARSVCHESDGAERRPPCPKKSLPKFEAIIYEVTGPVATITLDRPEMANAQNTQLIDEGDAAFDLADADDLVRVVVLCRKG